MKKIMKVKNVLIAMVFSVAVLGGYQAYEYANMSISETLLLENAAALTQARESSSLCGLEKDDCTIRFGDETSLNAFVGRYPAYASYTVGSYIDITDLTLVFDRSPWPWATKVPCEDNVYCNDIKEDFM